MDVMNYDPNMVNSGRTATQRVRLTFGSWDYRKTMDVLVRGNITGLQVIEAAIDNAYAELPTVNGFETDYAHLVLDRGEDTLECDDEEEGCEEWLADMLISAEIVSIEPNGMVGG